MNKLKLKHKIELGYAVHYNRSVTDQMCPTDEFFVDLVFSIQNLPAVMHELTHAQKITLEKMESDPCEWSESVHFKVEDDLKMALNPRADNGKYILTGPAGNYVLEDIYEPSILTSFFDVRTTIRLGTLKLEDWLKPGWKRSNGERR
jgi:hypothetical protein